MASLPDTEGNDRVRPQDWEQDAGTEPRSPPSPSANLPDASKASSIVSTSDSKEPHNPLSDDTLGFQPLQSTAPGDTLPIADTGRNKAAISAEDVPAEVPVGGNGVPSTSGVSGSSPLTEGVPLQGLSTAKAGDNASLGSQRERYGIADHPADLFEAHADLKDDFDSRVGSLSGTRGQNGAEEPEADASEDPDESLYLTASSMRSTQEQGSQGSLYRRNDGFPERNRATVPDSDQEAPIHSSGSSTESQEASDTVESEQTMPYRQLIEQLHEFSPHLHNVSWTHCRHAEPGHLYARIKPQEGETVLPWEVFDWDEGQESTAIMDLVMSELLRPHDTCIILLEGLSASLLEAMGTVFEMEPEFFEAHLHGSGYNGSYGGMDPQTWPSSILGQTYATLRWHRPIRRKRLRRPLSEDDRKELLKAQIHQDTSAPSALEWEEEDYIQHPDEPSSRCQRLRLHKASTTSNIFRREWSLSTDPEDLIAVKEHSPTGAWEERATMYRKILRDRHFVIILLDPLPKLSYTLQTIILPPNPSKRSSSSKVTTRTSTYIPYYPASPRHPPMTGTVDIVARRTSVIKPSSTRNNMVQWMRNERDPVLALLEVISCDTTRLLQGISIALDEITLGSLDDQLMQERLHHWRLLINRFLGELPQTRSGIQDFVDFAYEKRPPPRVIDLVNALAMQIDAMAKKAEKCYDSLRADMSILESRRGIAEAESVGKLTELAFLFIPLTFAASCFSMSIDQLESPAPLSSFVVAAVIAVGVSYSMRILVRSSSLIAFKRMCYNSIRRDAGVEPGNRIPNRAFVHYGYGRFGTSTLLATCVVAIAVAPVIPLWTGRRELNAGFKAVITAIVVMSDLLCFAVLAPTIISESDLARKGFDKFVSWVLEGNKRKLPGNSKV